MPQELNEADVYRNVHGISKSKQITTKQKQINRQKWITHSKSKSYQED